MISDFSIDGHCDVIYMPKKFNGTRYRLNIELALFFFPLLFVCFIASNKNCLKIVFFSVEKVKIINNFVLQSTPEKGSSYREFELAGVRRK